MPTKTKVSGSKRTELAAALGSLERSGTKKTRDGMARYGIVASHAFGVPVGTIRSLAKRIGRDHQLAAALWDTGTYEARLLAAFVADPARVTPREMDHWCKGFENWADCDTACFALFDRTPHAFAKIKQWARRRPEFERRAAFALLASVALHDKAAPDEPFLRCLPLIEDAASDDRNFVKKAVSWALRGVGRRNPALHREALALARRLATSSEPSARFVGKDALRELTSAAVLTRLKRPKRA